MIQKFLPHSPIKSTITYEIFRNRHSTDEEFHLIADMYERVMREDKVLCDAAQQNVREAVTAHWKREKTEGGEIWPASREQVLEKEEHVDTNQVTDISSGPQKEVLAW